MELNAVLKQLQLHSLSLHLYNMSAVPGLYRSRRNCALLQNQNGMQLHQHFFVEGKLSIKAASMICDTTKFCQLKNIDLQVLLLSLVLCN